MSLCCDYVGSNIDDVCHKVNIRLLNCPFDNCGDGLNHKSATCTVDPNEPWIAQLCCPVCHKNWRVCRDCVGGKVKALLNDSQLKKHRKLYHGKPASVSESGSQTKAVTSKSRKRKDISSPITPKCNNIEYIVHSPAS